MYLNGSILTHNVNAVYTYQACYIVHACIAQALRNGSPGALPMLVSLLQHNADYVLLVLQRKVCCCLVPGAS